jgi:shikimate kinase
MKDGVGAAGRPRPLVVELVGAWGAGKSSLVRSLVRRDESVRAAPPVWSLPKPLLALGGLQTSAILIRALGGGGRLHWHESRQLVRLRALCHNLELLRKKGNQVVVVEDGPALILSWLRAAAHRSATNGGMAPWWNSAVRRWAKTVDVVVFLDAPDRVLSQRVLARPQSNPFKDRPETELAEVLERSRAAYGEVLSDLGALDGPPVLPFRTDEQSVAEITEQVLLTLQRRRNGH